MAPLPVRPTVRRSTDSVVALSRYVVRRRTEPPVVLKAGDGSRLPQEGAEAGLNKVLVVGEGLGDAAFFHHDKRDAVRQPPLLVLTAGKKVLGALDQRMRQRDDGDALVVPDPRKQRYDERPQGR